MSGFTCCVLAIAAALLVGCGKSPGGRSSLSGSDIVPGGNIVIGGVIEGAPPAAPTPSPAPPAVSPTQCGGGLATQDLAGQCRAAPTTPGALEAVDGTSTTMVSIASITVVPQTVSRLLQVSWQPFGSDTAGYMVDFGKTADTANVLVSDLPTNSGLFDPGAPTVTYDSVGDLGLYAGDTVCFRVYAYNPAHTIVGEVFLGCSAV